MTEVEYSAEIVEGLVFQNVEGGDVRIVGAHFDEERRAIVFQITGGAIPLVTPKTVRVVVRQEDEKFFTRFVAD